MIQGSIKDYVLQNLERHRGSWDEVAKVTGISIHAIRHLVQRKHQNPRLDKLEKLATYFKRAR